MKKIICIALAAALAMMCFVGCSSEPLAVVPDSADVLVGQSILFDINKEGATWETSDAAIATIDESGTATAISVGEAEITATVGEEKVVIKLTVLPAGSFDEDEKAPNSDEIDTPTPEPTVSPEVKETPEFVESPEAEVSAEPTATAKPVETATAKPTATPAPTKAPEKTAEPTKTPEPVKTPEPTKAPVATPTPEPTVKPTPTPAPATPEPTPTPAPATPEPTPAPTSDSSSVTVNGGGYEINGEVEIPSRAHMGV